MYIKPTSLAKQTGVHIEKDGYAKNEVASCSPLDLLNTKSSLWIGHSLFQKQMGSIIFQTTLQAYLQGIVSHMVNNTSVVLFYMLDNMFENPSLALLSFPALRIWYNVLSFLI